MEFRKGCFDVSTFLRIWNRPDLLVLKFIRAVLSTYNFQYQTQTKNSFCKLPVCWFLRISRVWEKRDI